MPGVPVPAVCRALGSHLASRGAGAGAGCWIWPSAGPWQFAWSQLVLPQSPSQCHLLPCPLTAHCLFPPQDFGTGLYFAQKLRISKERLQHKCFRLKPEKRQLLQGALHTSAISLSPRVPHTCLGGWGSHGPIPTGAPRPLGVGLGKPGRAAPYGSGC